MDGVNPDLDSGRKTSLFFEEKLTCGSQTGCKILTVAANERVRLKIHQYSILVPFRKAFNLVSYSSVAAYKIPPVSWETPKWTGEKRSLTSLQQASPGLNKTDGKQPGRGDTQPAGWKKPDYLS